MDKALREKINRAMGLYSNDPVMAMKLAKQILREGNAQKDDEAVAFGHYIMGASLFSEGKREGMLKHAQHAVAYFSNSDDYLALSKSQNLLGIAYSSIEEYQHSMENYMDALHTAERSPKCRTMKHILLNNIGTCYYAFGDNKTALRYTQKTYKRIMKQKKPDINLLNKICYNLSDMYERVGEMEKALFYVNECAKLLEGNQNPVEKILYYCRRTKLFYACGDEENGNLFSDKLIERIKLGESSYEFLDDIEWIALHQIERGEVDRADYLADYLADYADMTGFILDKIRSYRVQAFYFEHIKDYERAVFYFKRIDQMNQEYKSELLKIQLKAVENKEKLEKKMEEFKYRMEYKEIESSKDALTGLFNRRSMSKVLERYIERGRTKGTTTGCIFIDIDYFKEYNDTYGHVKGDEILKIISAACIRTEKDRQHIHFARYGGDEFFGMLSGYSDEEIISIAGEIYECIRELNIEHKHPHAKGHITFSAGIVNMKLGDGHSIIDIVNKSDKALYHAKESGRDAIYMIRSDDADNHTDIEYEKIK